MTLSHWQRAADSKLIRSHYSIYGQCHGTIFPYATRLEKQTVSVLFLAIYNLAGKKGTRGSSFRVGAGGKVDATA